MPWGHFPTFIWTSWVLVTMNGLMTSWDWHHRHYERALVMVRTKHSLQCEILGYKQPLVTAICKRLFLQMIVDQHVIVT